MERMSEMKREWTVDEIKNLLSTNDKMVCRSLMKLYELQTADEQADQETHIRNGVGFNGYDAPLLTSFAQFFNQTGFLTMKQTAICRKMLMKYAKQLTNIANA